MFNSVSKRFTSSILKIIVIITLGLLFAVKIFLCRFRQTLNIHYIYSIFSITNVHQFSCKK